MLQDQLLADQDLDYRMSVLNGLEKKTVVLRTIRLYITLVFVRFECL